MSTQTPRAIAFEDIRKGDRIEAAWLVGDREQAYRGVAAYTSGYENWCTEEGMLLAERGAEGTITLLHRPTVTEPTGLGAVVRTAEDIEYVSVNRQPGTPRWVDAMIGDEHGERWALKWDDLEFDRDSIGVLSEGIEVDE